MGWFHVQGCISQDGNLGRRYAAVVGDCAGAFDFQHERAGTLDLGRKVSVSKAVEEVKTSSSKWMKTQGRGLQGFAWQAGYGAFGVSESNVEAVRNYIAGQQEHHRKKTFQKEYRAFLERHRIAYDERYVWD